MRSTPPPHITPPQLASRLRCYSTPPHLILPSIQQHPSQYSSNVSVLAHNMRATQHATHYRDANTTHVHGAMTSCSALPHTSVVAPLVGPVATTTTQVHTTRVTNAPTSTPAASTTAPLTTPPTTTATPIPTLPAYCNAIVGVNEVSFMCAS